MKTIDHIPTSKLQRAGKILKTGLKVGKNYAGYYGGKMINADVSREKLDENNASDIMESLQQLKGGGLKIAQMLSMEKNLLPKAYVDEFSLAQFSVPPLSAPLVKQTFKKYLGKYPEEIFDQFNYAASFAASIGQVHEAYKDGKRLAVKIQYPGVAESITSDLAMLKPMASKLLRLNMNDTEKYFKEVEDKLIEETNYTLELERSQELTKACAHLVGVKFPTYYPEYSSNRIITMDWIEGKHLAQHIQSGLSQEESSSLGQRIWDLFMYQIHELRKVHADPHPGNILITADNQLAIIDFGCIKEIPEEFYIPYFKLTEPGIIDNKDTFEQILFDLEILREGDKPAEKEYFYNLFHEVLSLLLKPYQDDTWDFSDNEYFDQIAAVGERMSRESLTSKYKLDRGSKHFIYINRTFFGLYQLMHMLDAEIHVPYNQSTEA